MVENPDAAITPGDMGIGKSIAVEINIE